MKPAVRDLTLESKSKFPHLSESVTLAVKKGIVSPAYFIELMAKCFINWKALPRSTEYPYLSYSGYVASFLFCFLRNHTLPYRLASCCFCKVIKEGCVLAKGLGVFLRIPVELVRMWRISFLFSPAISSLPIIWTLQPSKSRWETDSPPNNRTCTGANGVNTNGNEGSAISLIYQWRHCGSESWNYLLVVTRQLNVKALRFACHCIDRGFTVFTQRNAIVPLSWATADHVSLITHQKIQICKMLITWQIICIFSLRKK